MEYPERDVMIMSGDNAPWQSEEWLEQKYCVEGMTMAEIADECDASYDTIRYYKDKYNIEGRPNGLSVEAHNATKDDLERMYWDEGLSLKGVGDELNVSQTWVIRKMNELGIDRRQRDNEKGTAWKDADRLERMYWDEDMTLEEIGDELGCSASTISQWMQRFDIDREKLPEEKPPSHRITHEGYEEVRTKIDQKQYSVLIHRLLAVAEGLLSPQAYADGLLHVHHKNGVPWDNRPSNLEVLTKSEHHKHHYDEIPKDGENKFRKSP